MGSWKEDYSSHHVHVLIYISLRVGTVCVLCVSFGIMKTVRGYRTFLAKRPTTCGYRPSKLLQPDDYSALTEKHHDHGLADWVLSLSPSFDLVLRCSSVARLTKTGG